MNSLNEITFPIQDALDRFETYFGQKLVSQVLPMDAIMSYLLETKGKRMRPMLVFLCAKLLGEINEKTYRAATFVEMIHTATLIHDDVVDDSDERRGRLSVKARWNNVAAVLSGDYMMAKAMLMVSGASDSDVLREVMLAAEAMSEGELLQNSMKDRSMQESEYLDVITRKTAMLMRSCCAVGALSVQASEEQVRHLAEFGLHFGLVFQMRDDILDADHPQNTVFAQTLLPVYREKALECLDAFSPSDILDALRSLTVFCAERTV